LIIDLYKPHITILPKKRPEEYANAETCKLEYVKKHSQSIQ